MRYRGRSFAVREVSKAKWEAWRQQASSRPHVVRFAERLIELIESRVGAPHPHVRDLASWALTIAKEEVNPTPTEAQQREVILTLSECWRYGPSLRNWAYHHGLIE